MHLINPISFVNKSEEIKDEPLGINFSFLRSGEANIPLSDTYQSQSNNTPKKKTKTKNINGTDVVLANESNDLPMYQSNEPYDQSYSDTTNMLRGSIRQIDVISVELKSDLDQIRSSKTLKKKYDYLSLMNGTMGTLIGTKINAIKEINNTISKCHDLEMKRMKELKINSPDVDDDKKIMDMYNAFISAPVGAGGYSALGPSGVDMTLSGVAGIVRSNMPGSGADGGYQNYLNNMTPSQNMMRYESNPDVKQVVVYDQSSGRRWFDVMNVRTGESIPNVSKKDAMFLEDTTIDLKNMQARNVNLDEVYPLIVVGNGMNDY